MYLPLAGLPQGSLRLLSTHSDWFGLLLRCQGTRSYWAGTGQIEGLHLWSMLEIEISRGQRDEGYDA